MANVSAQYRDLSNARWRVLNSLIPEPIPQADGRGRPKTTSISSSQVTAVIPAALLQSPTSVQILVMNGDVMGMSDGYFGYPRSNSVTFTVGP